MKNAILFLLLVSLSQSLMAQSDSVLLTFFYAKNGEVYAASNYETNESVYRLDEVHLGTINLNKRDVSNMKALYQMQMVRIELTDNTIYRGKLVDINEEHFVLETEIAGNIEFKRYTVMTVVPIQNRMAVSNPNKTRYFFGPSAIPMDKGDGYYQNAYLLMNSANFGLSKNFSMGGGIVIPIFFFITPKLSFQLSEKFYAGVGVFAGTTFIPGAIISGVLPYGVVTYGTEENNITLGSGWGFVWTDGDQFSNNLPITTLNGMFRISKRLQFITENWVIPIEDRIEEYVVTGTDKEGYDVYEVTYRYENTAAMAFSAGMRIVAGDRASFDIAPVYLGFPGENGIVVPYLDFVYKF